MDKIISKFTVLFEDPFWIGVFEKYDNGRLYVAKVTFGSEPKDYELYEYINNHYDDLVFSPAVEADIKQEKKNPKKREKDIKKQMQNKGIGTKSQQALKLQQEEYQKLKKEQNKEKKENDKKQMFELKQKQKKEKHKGH